MTTITERIALGAKFLDEDDPEWWRADVKRAIDLGALDLSDGSACILGQRCPLEIWTRHRNAAMNRYEAQASALSGIAPDWDELDNWAADHGFQGAGHEYDSLTAEWKRVITERRSAP